VLLAVHPCWRKRPAAEELTVFAAIAKMLRVTGVTANAPRTGIRSRLDEPAWRALAPWLSSPVTWRESECRLRSESITLSVSVGFVALVQSLLSDSALGCANVSETLRRLDAISFAVEQLASPSQALSAHVRITLSFRVEQFPNSVSVAALLHNCQHSVFSPTAGAGQLAQLAKCCTVSRAGHASDIASD